MLPITDDDLRRWQIRKADRLAKLLKGAAKAKLPPLTWTAPPAGPLLGVADSGDAAKRRETFEQWVTFLGAERGAGWGNGVTQYLTAYVTPEGRDFREIAISARIPLDD